MDSLPPELSLNIRPTFVPKTINAFLKELSMIGNGSDKVTKLDDFVRRLEEEMRKIDAFKRELPLCMLLLHDAILALKSESLQFKVPKAEPESLPVLEEFIPMKKLSENEGISKEKEWKDKKHWMSSFQLYDYRSIDPPKSNGNKGNEEEIKITAEVDAFAIKKRNVGTGGGRAFWPSSPFPLGTKEEREELPVPGLSLLTPRKNLREESGSSGFKTSCSRAVSCRATDVQSSSHAGPLQSPTARKQRRSWSPELHRRFVNALQQLGGSQVATPKQIRELMQVDGLTNDEVKSHLQKYRLHTRRASRATGATPANQSVVVLGGLWMPQDQCGESSKANASQSDSPQGPFQLGTPAGSVTGSDSMDDDDVEDEKSESYSWKSHIHRPMKNAV